MYCLHQNIPNFSLFQVLNVASSVVQWTETLPKERRDFPASRLQKYKEGKTRFWVFGGGWVQSSYSFHDYLFFIGLYASLYIGDEEN